MLTPAALSLALSFALAQAALPAEAPQPAEPAKEAAKGAEPPRPAEEHRVEFDYELNPYYSSVNAFFSVSDEPIRHLGEMDELEMYLSLLPRAFDPRQLVPRFIVLEASVNPLPCAGLVIRGEAPGFYSDAQVSPRLNGVKAVTAGFEEPYALSILGGNFVNFDVPGRDDVKGKGYGGLLVSVGTHHIKDNQLYRDDWIEIESKVKGDRRSPVKKLSWSFRVGAKIHGNPNIADIVYLGIRRSRLDYVENPTPLLSNWGFEYRFDVVVDRIAADGLRQARHVLLVDKKFLLPRTKLALTLKAGFIYTLADAYRGALARAGKQEDFQFVLRPNIEF
ncbi:MAG TPA: hypothetical protein VLT47_01635 [Anaeromyxobacteraceae bacterium]|nr:hypothetical protein [Anaeromyxobacteraceae bacterium]